MLSNEVKKVLNQMIPVTYTVNGTEVTPKQTFGGNPLGEFQGPTINFSLPVDGLSYRKFIGELVYTDETRLQSGEAQTSLLIYKVAALDTQTSATEEIVHSTGTQGYTLANGPLLSITSIAGFVAGVDYILGSDRKSVEWLGASTPADSETFTVVYEYIESGYWIASQIATELRKYILANLKVTLAPYYVDVQHVSEARDISAVFVRENVFGFAFDVQVVYTYYWSRALTDEDGPILEQISNTLSQDDYSETTIFN